MYAQTCKLPPGRLGAWTLASIRKHNPFLSVQHTRTSVKINNTHPSPDNKLFDQETQNLDTGRPDKLLDILHLTQKRKSTQHLFLFIYLQKFNTTKD